MKQKHLTPFEITGIDSLGQGVSKISEKITFIPKTTIGDVGEAVVMAEKKGVAFARVTTLSKASSGRIHPECDHYSQCSSCHYLHVSYSDELKFKKESYERLFRKLPLPPVEVIAAPERFHYRNRIQLHYSIKKKLLGMRDPQTFEITPIPLCKIGLPQVLNELARLYQNEQWLKETPPSAPTDGHLEIYLFNNAIQTSWNKPYAEGGFTQVYERMNQKLKSVLEERWSITAQDHLLDLFGGNGNLSSSLPYSKRLCVDIYKNLPGKDFVNQDLYDQNAFRSVQREIKERSMRVSHLLLDPPRSGFKGLAQWLESLKPQMVAYVSCDPHTLARDLQDVQNYSFTGSFLIDFFPSTFHFESMIFLERKW